MSKIKTSIIDNWLEPDLADFLSVFLERNLLYSTDHCSNPSNPEELAHSNFLKANLHNQEPMVLFLFSKIKKIKSVNLLRCYVNLHYVCHGGKFHQDDGQTTFIYMPSKNIEGGEFEIMNEPRIEYKFNRLIYFDASTLHKGNAPTNKLGRMTLAFKTQDYL